MPEFRKKPVVVEARHFDGTPENGSALVAWLYEHAAGAEYYPGDPNVHVAHRDPYMRIATLEGTMVASSGDWIIRGVQGEFYPCKPDIFAATYEHVAGAPAEPSLWRDPADTITARKGATTTLHTFTSEQLDQVRADAWDEGYMAVPAEPEDRAFFVEDAENPYRKDTDHE